MELENLIKDLKYKNIEGKTNIDVKGIKDNSREVEDGDLFIAIKGAKFDGNKYIQDAIDKGAKVIVREETGEIPAEFKEATFITVEDSRDALAKLAANFYDNPSEKLTVVGITGTKGKTTTSNMILQTLENAGIKVGAISTRGIAIDGELIDTNNTTPGALDVQKYLKKMVDLGYTHAVVEVSSQGFKQKRAGYVDFDIGVFLNIALDHVGVNEHESFEDYLNCKKEIIRRSPVNVVSINDNLWKYIKDMDFGELRTVSSEKVADYYFDDFQIYQEPYKYGITSEFKGRVPGNIKLSVLGKFNLENALAALAVIDILGIDPDIFFKTMENFHVEGRTQLFTSLIDKGRTVFTDYAHNKLSIENLLTSIRSYHPERRIITMYSYEYYETKLRRYEYGETVGRLSDVAVVTSNSLGDYKFEDLYADTVKGLEDSNAEYYMVPDRAEALKFIVDHTTKDDIIVLFGNGDCHYSEVNGVKIPFYEEETLTKYLDEINANQ